MTKPKAEATESTTVTEKGTGDKCDYCGADIPAGGGVTAQGDGVTVRGCCWRHLHWRLVDIFTKGLHAVIGMK